MISSRELENRRKSNKSILGVVKAMKALSAANVRKGGTVLEHTRRYREFVDRAASVAASLPGVSILPEGKNTLIVAFGSQYGLCGALNERVLEDVAEAVRDSCEHSWNNLRGQAYSGPGPRPFHAGRSHRRAGLRRRAGRDCQRAFDDDIRQVQGRGFRRAAFHISVVRPGRANGHTAPRPAAPLQAARGSRACRPFSTSRPPP